MGKQGNKITTKKSTNIVEFCMTMLFRMGTTQYGSVQKWDF